MAKFKSFKREGAPANWLIEVGGFESCMILDSDKAGRLGDWEARNMGGHEMDGGRRVKKL